MTGACSFGHVLLTPERLPRIAAIDGEQALVDDLIASIVRASADAMQRGTMTEDFIAACESLYERLVARAGTGLDRAVQRLGDAVRPLRSLIETLPERLDRDDPAVVANELLDLLGSLGTSASKLSIETIREQVKLVLDIVEQDLGLTPSALEDELWALVDDLVERLETPREGVEPAITANRIAVAGTLRRIRRRSRGSFAFPALSADRIAQLIFDGLDALLEPLLEKAACVGHVTADLVDAIQAIKEAVPFSGQGSISIGAAGLPPRKDREYLWYASWLLDDDVWTARFDDLGEVVMLVDRQIVLRSGAGRACTIDPSTWAGLMVPNDGDRTYTFGEYGPQTMERLTHQLRWIGEAFETLFRLWYPVDGFTSKSLRLKKGNGLSATSLLDATYGGIHTAVKGSREAPIGFLIKPGLSGRFAGLTPTFLFHGLGSLQGMHWKADPVDAFKMWGVVLVVSDALDYAAPLLIVRTLRNGLLSALTMLNFDAKKGIPDNHRHTAGITSVCQALMDALLTRVMFPPRYYGHPVTGNTTQVPDWSRVTWLYYVLLLCPLWGWLGWWLGHLVASAFARKLVQPPDYAEDMALNMALSLGLFWVSLFTSVEGATEGGTLNLEGSTPFPGYQDPDASPYQLPWAAGDTYMCGQGNLGFFSHNFTNPGGPQVYSYDFMMDKDDEILAARSGVVVDYFDWVPDGTKADIKAEDDQGNPFTVPGQTAEDNWNFVLIRHDGPPHAQDLGPGSDKGPTLTTYAVYGHGRRDGVRNVFAARTTPVAAANIIGTRVAQGEPIMLVGTTGVNLCNHVHMAVRLGPPATDAPPIARGNLGLGIPFVFSDGGQPKTFEWLVSSNVRRTP